ncbi:Choline-sulfatase [Pontiella desulfatans]|uniref:Choline-sulfatase n=1 Tax=Pontiella desulfatans TaxID=2750659 RepID=A0A6C2TWN9_PONDE|nr:sulfatase [Pontiella desulfatans]SPS73635.1 sulfatase S1_7 [Kiritimatiellales bacterium]VGO11977.1 Choline-sulfatase [Pontiella desulfatans]
MKQLALIVGIGLALTVASAGNRPNILFIAIDDMNDWTGFLGGHPQAQTPNMDKLAKKGINFTNAHCSAPGCSPSRNALLYGVEPFNSGLYAFYDQEGFSDKVLEDYASIPQFFKNKGYRTYGSGKIHHRRVPTDVEWTEFYELEKSNPLKFDDVEGYRQGKSNKMRFSPTLSPLEDHTDYKNTAFGVDVLSREHDKPFFLAVGIVRPHLPFTCPKQFFDLYPKEVEPPRINPTDHSDIPAVGKAMAKVSDDRRFKQDEAWNKVRRAYLACISWADYNVGRLLDALDASPYAGNTVVVLWSDHGYGLGEKKHFRKFALWEETTRVPFIIWDAREGKPVAGREVKEGVSLINIYRTLAELSNLDSPEYVDGFSLVPQLRDHEAPVEGQAICSWGRGNYTVRTRDWRYTRYYNGGEELYDHTKDPDEWTNLAKNPEYTEVKNRLSSKLPRQEAPIVLDGLEGWSIPYSADKPLEKTNKGEE